MKSWAIAFFALLTLAGCASERVLPPADPALFQDQRFGPPSAPISAADIFTLTPEMKQYAQQVLHKQQDKALQQALFDALYSKGQLQLEYESTMTRNAAQAFDARAGNCLSLVIMTAALARELNLSVHFQSVVVDDSWSRSGNLYFSSGHVNLTLGKPKAHLAAYDATEFMTIDFLPPEDMRHQRALPIEENTIVAMYLNNRAAESMVNGKIDDAYWYARKAIAYDSGFMNAYNTLGVIYQHHGDVAAAERVLRYAHQQVPGNTVVMFNLAQALRDMNRPLEAQVLIDELARLEPHPPFYFFNLGRAAMAQHDYARARSLFARELARDPYYHEFHFWMAAASYMTGDLDDADKHMKLALENSTARSDHDLYAAKLDHLKAVEARTRARQ
ncbi:tetratricopeptide repeat protein [Rugamonas sp.]|uniref:tetratricopeptide repeat protein n=1 Tax=Rugamonas sp. TaxID=1926287 RepID=UPI0025CCD185|nr:tetratricopeptide repeat protein [Rugamonas sp.]